MPEPNFLTLAEVHYLHGQLIKRFGGTHGVRDILALLNQRWLRR